MIGMKEAADKRLWGVCLVCLGCVFLYGSLDAIQDYFATGQIVWGSSARRMTGEPALMMHGLWVLVGAYMAAEGVRRFLLGSGR
jgi:hypothetical protein